MLEFSARVVDHIPEPCQQMTRYWGFYTNAARGKRRKAGEKAAGAGPALAGHDAVHHAHGKRVRTAGSVTVRQRPGTAKGMLFLPLEDETGMSQTMVTPDLLQANRKIIVGSPGLVVEGILQKKDGTLSIKGEKFWRLPEIAAAPSHDFH